MNKDKIKSAQIVFNLLCLILLVLSTTIVLHITRKDVSTTDYQLEGAGYNGRAGVQWSFQMSNLTYDVEIEGWAFAETESDNLNKVVNLLFVSDKNSYLVSTDLFDEAWAKNYYKDLKVPASKNGFSAKFSPLGMKDGIYSLFAEVIENDTDSGIFYTYSDFRKVNNTFTKLESNARISNMDISGIVTTELVKWHIDECEVRGNKLYVSGWALHKNLHSLSNQIFVELIRNDGKAEYFSTSRVYRDGVGKQFGDSKFNMAGFWAEIPLDYISHGDNHLSMIIGTKYRSPDNYLFYLE